MNYPSWRLKILGEFVLERDGEIVDRFGGRREEALVAYLAIDPTTPKVRDQVAADLWPEAERRAGLKNISYNMFVMKKRLAEHGLLEPFEDVGNSSLRLSSEIQVDAQEFTEALAVGVSQAGQLAQVRRGLALYGGGLLPTYDESWVKPHQARFEELYQLALQHMTEVLAPTGVQEAILQRVPTTAWRGVSVAPEVVEPSVPARETRDDQDLAAFAREAEDGLEGEDTATWVVKVDELYPVIVDFFNEALNSNRTSEALEVAARLWRYWYLKGETSEGRLWLERLFQMREGGSALLRARASHALGCLTSIERDAPAAIEHLDNAIKLWRKLDQPERLVRSLNTLGMAHQYNDDMDRAAKTYDQAMAMAAVLGEDGVRATALYNRAQIAMNAQDYSRAKSLLAERLDVLPEGDSPVRAMTLAHLANCALEERELDKAAEWGADAAGLLADGDAPAIHVQVHQVLGQVDYQRGQFNSAADHFQLALEQAHRTKRLYLVGTSMAYLAFTLREQGDTDAAAELYRRATAVLEGAGIGRALDRIREQWVAED